MGMNFTLGGTLLGCRLSVFLVLAMYAVMMQFMFQKT